MPIAPGVEVLDHDRHLGRQRGQPAPTGDLLLRPAQLAAQEPADREVAVGAERAVSIDGTDQQSVLGFEATHRAVDLDQPGDALGRGEPGDGVDQLGEGSFLHAEMLSNIRTMRNPERRMPPVLRQL